MTFVSIKSTSRFVNCLLLRQREKTEIQKRKEKGLFWVQAKKYIALTQVSYNLLYLVSSTNMISANRVNNF